MQFQNVVPLQNLFVVCRSKYCLQEHKIKNGPYSLPFNMLQSRTVILSLRFPITFQKVSKCIS